MGNTLKGCLSCLLPCGAFDVVRIVHLSGYVEEISGPITAEEVLKANSNHVLSRLCSGHRTLILSPETVLEKGSIYVLLPASSLSLKWRRRYYRRKKHNADASITIRESALPTNHEYRHHRRRRETGEGLPWLPHLECINEH